MGAKTGLTQEAELEGDAGLEPGLTDAYDCVLLTAKLELIKISTSPGSFRILRAAYVTEDPSA